MKKFYWIHKDYQNESLNNLARRLVEYNTADLLSNGYDVFYTDTVPTDGSEYEYAGKLAVGNFSMNYSVADIPVINDIFNYNLYFPTNTQDPLRIPVDVKGTFDCLVSLGAGNMIETTPAAIGLQGSNHYVIDISPTAIHKSMGLYKEIPEEFIQLDIFNTDAVTNFLKTCKGTRGFWVVSNCFNYTVNSLIYDVKLRFKLQQQFLEVLANDTNIEWYVSIFTADGSDYHCARASDILAKQFDKRFEALPWIKK
jgi:hypothetical protein